MNTNEEFVFYDQTILLISPQAWGKMFVTKHHYAVELAARGNLVYFLNPPDNIHWSWRSRRRRIVIKSTSYKNVHLVEHQLFFPYILKFHARNLFDVLMKRHLRGLESLIEKKIDIVWSFDHGNISPLNYFRHVFKIFHPVDLAKKVEALKAAESANLVLSVADEILEQYEDCKTPKHLIRHGVADAFLQGEPAHINKQTIQVGLAGNWLELDLDFTCLLKIITRHPNLTFNFYGSYYLEESNLGKYRESEEYIHFTNALGPLKNVLLHGALFYTELAIQYKNMDAFLICYNLKKDQSKGTNYHKIMEFLGTGRVVIANNISAYKNNPELVQMVQERDHNESLPDLFDKVVNNLSHYNSEHLVHTRKEFAKDNTYQKQIERIEKLVRQAG